MFEDQDRIERLIVRSLDGELSGDQQLELNRELIKNPEARRMMDEYRAVDSLAGASLVELASADFALRPAAWGGSAARPFAWRMRKFWLIPGAIAAAILALLVPRPAFDDRTAFAPSPPHVASSWPNDGLVHPVSTGLPSVRRATGRDLIGVVGEDGNIYWIEVERTRTVRLPSGKSGSLSNRL